MKTVIWIVGGAAFILLMLVLMGVMTNGEEAARQTARDGLMESCLNRAGDPDFCGCAVDNIIEQYELEQIPDLMKQQVEAAARECV